MPVLILSPRHSSDSKALRQAALDMGWSVERLGDYVAPPEFKAYEAVIYGKAVFARLVAKSLDMVLLQPHLCWLAELRYQYRQREVNCETLGEARALSKPMFIKRAGEKSFIAQIYQSGDQLPPADVITDSTPVLVVELLQWETEFRCFVLDREPRAMSIYKRNGELARTENGDWAASPDEIEAALKYCQSLLNDPSVATPPAFVLDVGIIKDVGWAVIEANPAMASGIYGCNPVKILPVLQRATVKADSISDLDRAWVLR